MTGMVLLPGMMCDAGLWQHMAAGLSGYGPLMCGDLSRDSSQEEMATRVLSQAPERFTLVGFSMGGFVAREMVRQAGQRVRRLILIATSSQRDSPQTSAYKAATAQSLLNSHGTFRGLGQKAIALSLSEKHADDPRLQSQILEMSLRVGKEAYCRQLLMARHSDTHLLDQIRCPALVIAAAEDRMRRVEESRILYEHLPHATFEVIDDSGHMLPLEQPAELAQRICRWLADTTG
ncbi:alpha/beta fold hydrolase [Erwinia psidii]|uniref:Alpha/beta hydrolase n=1 Tax=Erwinia psidii TaxID=69224 RepID=A0A3N6RWB6_9GAMM|nr:alpha/beta hydrolase [Erwinia psidii]MCX8958785.1 alpha/beta hydrolase [Erwinia psidii]MCX8963066.1 alpha/beta hydrolase [Erwinia psidii]MCX8965935.1 alpha/beta hydrolase [Erwinia psidii]RQM36637.1 alpha/beta hydrolase [Erwinia psidii]